jgi:hypothetical protein
MKGSVNVEGRIPNQRESTLGMRTSDGFGMDGLQASSETLVGFLAVRQREPHGFFGGYLVVNARLRPTEFHCTLPVQPTRAQQILYGATLLEYVCGELIARALLSKASAKPSLILTDCDAALSARHWIDMPLAHVTAEPARSSESDGFTIPGVSKGDGRYAWRSVHGATFSSIATYASDLDALGVLDHFEGGQDLQEPFSRIVEALAEAHPRSRAA